MGIKKRQVFKILGISLALSLLVPLFADSVMAASYPTKPVRLIVAWPAGSSADQIGRLFASKLTERLGKQVIVDNRGGAAGVMGTEAAAQAAPDGYTLFFSQDALAMMHPSIRKLSFDPMKSLTPIAKLGRGPRALFVHPKVPANTVKELIALAKQKPGRVTFGSTGVGGGVHVGTELFKMMADIDFKIVQYKGGAPQMIDLLGGHTDAQFSALVQGLPHIKSGKIRLLATTGPKRSLPDVPTVAESLPGYEQTTWWGILAPNGTPAPIVDRLNNELKAILGLDEIRKWFLNEAAELDYLGPTEFGQFLEAELTKWAGVVKKANIKLE